MSRDVNRPPVASTARLGAAVGDQLRMRALRVQGLLDGVPEPAFDRFARVAARVAQCPTALVSVVSDEAQHFAGLCGVGQPWADARRTPLSHSFCQHVVANAAPLVVEDARTDPVLRTNLAIRDLGVVAYAGFPVAGPSGHVLASLCAIDSVPRVWQPEQLEALADVALLVAKELERRDLDRRLAVEARTDGLTLMANRRAWEEGLSSALNLARRLGHGLAVVLLDVDHFQAFNDCRGRQAGDAALREIGRRWRAQLRDVDVLARIGGEEFGLLAAGCDVAQAVTIADRLREDMPAGLTASAGAVAWSAPMTADDLLTAADRALYSAKRAGRDRTATD